MLVTGEGIETSLVAVAAALSQLPVTQVHNLGVALSLGALAVGQVCQIRTVYGEKSEGIPEFQSFSTTQQTRRNAGPVDVLSSRDRILTATVGEKWRPFATLIDREAWGVGFAARKMGVPLVVTKVVSDLLGDSDCDIVKSRAEAFAGQLWQAWEDTHDATSEKPKPKIRDWDHRENLHLSATQKSQLQKLRHRLELKERVNGATILSQVWGHLNEDPHFARLKPKDQGRKLIAALTTRLNPMRSLCEGMVEEAVRPLNQSGIQLKYDPDFECDDLTISATIRGNADWQSLRQSLDEFDFDQVVALLRGEDGAFPKDLH